MDSAPLACEDGEEFTGMAECLVRIRQVIALLFQTRITNTMREDLREMQALL